MTLLMSMPKGTCENRISSADEHARIRSPAAHELTEVEKLAKHICIAVQLKWCRVCFLRKHHVTALPGLMSRRYCPPAPPQWRSQDFSTGGGGQSVISG